jgi:hypothetical protein
MSLGFSLGMSDGASLAASEGTSLGTSLRELVTASEAEIMFTVGNSVVSNVSQSSPVLLALACKINAGAMAGESLRFSVDSS